MFIDVLSFSQVEHRDAPFGRGGRPDHGLMLSGPGNLMGPDHPMWGQHRISMGGGPGTMQPRYDPIGPPFGPTDIDDDTNNNPLKVPFRQRPPPGGTGVPNDTRLQPPTFGIFPGRGGNNGNSNMFL